MNRGQADIHVGIVTALPTECAAVRLLVDDLVDLPVAGDPNRYLAGWLPSRYEDRRHHLVIALQAEDGTRNAAAICTDLTRSFPGIRCVVMCGVAGGIPAPDTPDRHVRLGDIAVASRGVIDYDHTRTVEGRDQLRRSVEGISRVLMRADRELAVKELGGVWPWRTWLGGDRPFPGVFARPTAGDQSGAGEWPQVHRCAIASADRLVRDAVLRDTIAERHEVRAVEMEASGIAVGTALHSTHWFVVRGIADYCDAGKNDLWQPYAALVAAAYVRALLAECDPFTVHRGPMSHGGGLGAIIDALLDVPQMRDDYQRRGIMSLLPDHIRTMIADNVNGRLHVLAMVQTCIDADDGQESLLRALRLSLPAESVVLRHAAAAIEAYWPTPSRAGTDVPRWR